MQLPRDVIVGHGVLGQLPRVLEDLSLGESVLVITGRHTRAVAGKKVIAMLTRKYDTRTFLAEEISPAVIREAEREARGAEILVAVGGGKIIDTAKIASFNTDRQFISVPTAASHDGIASASASVPTPEGNLSLKAHPPVAIVADTGIIASAPHRLLASGCADIISNLSAVLDWELAHRLRGETISEYASTLSRMTAEAMIRNADLVRPNTEETAWMVVKALVASGVAMSIAGSSRPASGGEHKFSHALDRIAPGKGLHGEKCGIGTIITLFLHGEDWREVREALKKIGAPTTPREIGIDDATAVEALLLASTIRPERFTILDTGITRDSAESLIRMLSKD
ncbi:MAG: NAD(P)-dependent glycerol-1-phosphate dehydrogenase [Methanomicrobiales archaeon]|nr:NAD(P)-dependent glycerol-1-phosphate dehydrogenase [Methanomicrobiales archaeon]MDD1671310.1 NAD(P)-dependent glycerol-1-phosphate dehydrogenase [Methanomicrobiales archaeon]